MSSDCLESGNFLKGLKKFQTPREFGESRAEDHPPKTLHLCGHLRFSKDLKSSALSSYNTDL